MRKSGRGLALVLASVMTMASLAGCGVNVSSKDDMAAVTVQTTTTTGETVATKEGGKVTLRVVDWSDSIKGRYEAFHRRLMEGNPDVIIGYTTLTSDRSKKTVASAVKVGNAPDLFPIPSDMRSSFVVNESWFTSMNEYVGEGFLSSFGANALNERITALDGRAYVPPEAINIINALILYSKTVLNEAGIDEDSLPKAWGESREVCKQVTEAGGGKFYGMIDNGAQANRLKLELRSLTGTAGGRCNDISQTIMVDGRNTLSSEAMVKAFDFFDTPVRGGSMHPDSVTLKTPEARTLFTQNQAASLVQGA